jgi:hypothetical protein
VKEKFENKSFFEAFGTFRLERFNYSKTLTQQKPQVELSKLSRQISQLFIASVNIFPKAFSAVTHEQ